MPGSGGVEGHRGKRSDELPTTVMATPAGSDFVSKELKVQSAAYGSASAQRAAGFPGLSPPNATRATQTLGRYESLRTR